MNKIILETVKLKEVKKACELESSMWTELRIHLLLSFEEQQL